MENRHFPLCLFFTLLAILLGSQYSMADTGSPDTYNAKPCSLIDEEIQILKKLLSQESSIRELKENFDNITDEAEKLSKIKDFILSTQVDIKTEISTINDRLDEFSRAMEASTMRMDTIQAYIKKNVERLDKRVTNLLETDIFERNDTYDKASLCPTDDVNRTAMEKSVYVMTDCSDIHQRYPELKSGPYRIYPAGGTGYIAYCDMETDGGGWTVFQRRRNGRVDFFRGWDDYRKGFGGVNGEHWLGNVALSELTANCPHCELRIELEDFEGNQRYAKYSNFSVGGETTGFVLNIGDYSGDAGNSLKSGTNHNHNGKKFSTKDKDQDRSGSNCANLYHGAWWFDSCFGAHLNGWYFDSQTTNRTWEGIIWKTWKGKDYSLQGTKMMLREEI